MMMMFSFRVRIQGFAFAPPRVFFGGLHLTSYQYHVSIFVSQLNLTVKRSSGTKVKNKKYISIYEEADDEEEEEEQQQQQEEEEADDDDIAVHCCVLHSHTLLLLFYDSQCR
jgi:hypothetical protein